LRLRSISAAVRVACYSQADDGGDPALSVRAIVIAGGLELVDAAGAFLERFVAAVGVEHQIGSAPDMDLRYHSAG